MTSKAEAPLLAPYAGRIPDRPAWFSAALEHSPERAWQEVQGTPIETLTWGEPGLPGLLLMHGKMAHADWWSFIAPFFAATHRVVALSFSGMGGSGWRDAYSVETMAAEAMAVAGAAGLFDGDAEGANKPVLVAHSFGAFAALLCAQHHGKRLGGVMTVDMPLLSREQREARRAPRIRGAFSARPTRVYPRLAEALARFRFAPEQICRNHYIADHIARTSLKQVALESGESPACEGWTWRFDPRVADIHPGNPAHSLRAAACPVAICWGGESALVTPEVSQHVRSLTAPGTPQIEIAAARHHVMVDQPLAFVAALRDLLAAWPLVPPA